MISKANLNEAIKAAVKTAPTERTREVKRYRAICPWGEHPNNDAIFKTRDAAEVAAVRHVRTDHAASMVEQVAATRRTRVVREVLGEEVKA